MKKYLHVFSTFMVIALFFTMAVASGGSQEEAEEEAKNAMDAGDAKEVTSTDLWLAYDGNEVRADEDYKGKALKVTGKVMDITKVLGDIVVKLEGNPDNQFMNVYCEFSKDHTSEAASLEKDQYVTILGMCKGKPLVDVKLEGCKLMPSDDKKEVSSSQPNSTTTKKTSSNKTASGISTVEGTKKCLVGNDWGAPNSKNPIWKETFNSNGTFNQSIKMFGGMSTWGTWKVISPGKILIHTTGSSETDLALPEDQIATLSSCNKLKINTTNYVKM